MTTKTIKTTLLEKRFMKLHTMVFYAEESCKATIFYAKRFESFFFTDEQKTVCQEMIVRLEDFIDKLNDIDVAMKTNETMYYKYLSFDKVSCKLIERVPVCQKFYVPNTFQMAETFYRVGYYTIEGDPFRVGARTYHRDDIIKNIQELVSNIHHCLLALNTATYDGFWKSTELLVNQLNNNDALDASVEKLLSVYYQCNV